MATVEKTFVRPDFSQNQTRIDPQTGMAEGYSPASFGVDPLMMFASTQKPIKTVQTQVTTPYALDDLLTARGQLGLSTKGLNDALKARESTGYSIANALAGISQQQGPGSWLTDFARSFGSAMSTPTNALVDRAQQKYKADLQDLANRLAYDKAMGGTVTTDYGYSYPESSTDSNMLAWAMLLGNK